MNTQNWSRLNMLSQHMLWDKQTAGQAQALRRGTHPLPGQGLYGRPAHLLACQLLVCSHRGSWGWIIGMWLSLGVSISLDRGDRWEIVAWVGKGTAGPEI